MKLKFKNQDFQTDAVNAVVDLFAGQEKTRGTFSVETENQTNLLYNAGVGNALSLTMMRWKRICTRFKSAISCR